MTIRKKDNYYAFATAEEPLGAYLEVTEHTKHYQCLYYVGVTLVLLHITIKSMYYFYEMKVKHLFTA